jgi:hypothetical protein
MRKRKMAQKSLSEPFVLIVGAAGRNRTHDPLVRSQVLYPAELQPPDARIIAKFCQLAKWANLQRRRAEDPADSLAGKYRRIPWLKRKMAQKDQLSEPFLMYNWRGWQESNPRPLGS